MSIIHRGPQRRRVSDRRKERLPFPGEDRREMPDRRRAVVDRRSDMNVTFIAFLTDDNLFGIHIGDVHEINKLLSATPVPRSEPFFRGLINLRGDIIPLIDLRTRLGLPSAEPTAATSNVILTTDSGKCGLVVDEVVDAITVANDRLGPPPANLGDQIAPFVKNICPIEKQLIIVLGAREVADTWIEEIT